MPQSGIQPARNAPANPLKDGHLIRRDHLGHVVEAGVLLRRIGRICIDRSNLPKGVRLFENVLNRHRVRGVSVGFQAGRSDEMQPIDKEVEDRLSAILDDAASDECEILPVTDAVRLRIVLPSGESALRRSGEERSQHHRLLPRAQSIGNAGYLDPPSQQVDLDRLPEAKVGPGIVCRHDPVRIRDAALKALEQAM
jgi:hypothetical protein